MSSIPTQSEIAPSDGVINSRASFHALLDDAPVDNKTPATSPHHLSTPTGNTMSASATALLKHDLPLKARIGRCYPDLHYQSLISVSQICDSGLTA